MGVNGTPGTSLPTWGRGLKFVVISVSAAFASVAPYMGAWIEIVQDDGQTGNVLVAPYMGAWIEITVPRSGSTATITSLPTWERGLKSVSRAIFRVMSLSLPTWERGLKSSTRHSHRLYLRVAPYMGAWIEIEISGG